MEDNPKKELFQTFHYLHSKEYELNSEEGLKRYRIFKRNLQWIKNENAKLHQTVYGITQFSDMTHKEYFIGRNSWGTSWGYQGHFKIPKDNDCLIQQRGWLPQMKDAPEPKPEPKPEPPKPKPEPKPDPVPANDCVELYGPAGFSSKPLLKACDAVPELEKLYFYGVKFPAKPDPKLSVRAFPWQDCGGMYNIHIRETTEFIEKDGYKAYSASMARQKEGKSGCVNFFTKSCLGGDAQFEICDDIKDTQLVDFSQFYKVQSILPGLGVHRVSFFTQPNYEGFGIALEGK